MAGLWGKVLRVDLTGGTVKEEDIPEDWQRKFMGGRGLGVRYLVHEVPKNVDPYGPDNPLIFMTGLLTGTPSPSSGRYTVVTKSPLTGICAEANSGGFWGPAFKGNGYDGVIFNGISEKPVYLVLDEGKVELRSADHLWGKNVTETTRIIQKELGEEFEVVCIGTAGENLVRFACPINDEHRAPGRCGMGAVMGSKRLKAIACKGTRETLVADKERFTRAAQKNYEFLSDSFIKVGLETYGTAMVLDMVNARGFFPFKNFQEGFCSWWEDINPEALNEKVLVERKACYGCTIACGRVSEVRTGPYKGMSGEGPEYETISTVGGMCAVDDMEAITAVHILCDDYGLDTVSYGNTIAFAMECYEKGILTKEETGGLDLTWGNAAVAVELVSKVANREGIGDLLAEGTRRAAQKLGKGAEKYAMNVKGLELPGYDPRGSKLLGLSFATASRGGCHVMSMMQMPSAMDFPILIVDESKIIDPQVENVDEVHILVDLENAVCLFDTSGACKFMGVAMSYEEWVEIIAAASGWDFDYEQYKRTGERVMNVERLCHIKQGLTRADDILPSRFFEEPMPGGASQGQVFTRDKFNMLLDKYYELRGWDKDGKPTPEKLKQLGLEDVMKECEVA